jgi:hypothetical protein
MHQNHFRLGRSPRPRWGHSAPPDPLAEIGEGEGREGRGRVGRGGEGRRGEDGEGGERRERENRTPPDFETWIRLWFKPPNPRGLATRPLSRRTQPPPPAGIEWRRRKKIGAPKIFCKNNFRLILLCVRARVWLYCGTVPNCGVLSIGPGAVKFFYNEKGSSAKELNLYFVDFTDHAAALCIASSTSVWK